MELGPKRQSPLWFWGPNSIIVVYMDPLGKHRQVNLVFIPTLLHAVTLCLRFRVLGFRAYLWAHTLPLFQGIYFSIHQILTIKNRYPKKEVRYEPLTLNPKAQTASRYDFRLLSKYTQDNADLAKGSKGP